MEGSETPVSTMRRRSSLRVPVAPPPEPKHNFEANGKQFKFADNALYCFGTSNPVRQRVVEVVTNPWFDRFILTLIVLNSIVLALTDYSSVDSEGELTTEGSWRNQIVESTEVIFTVCFSTECVLKVVGMGFVSGEGSYLRDPWNVLDFVVVVAGLVANLPKVPKISVLRTFRVMRPLRSLSALPGLRLLVGSLLGSIPALLNVILLLTFVFAVFGILGVQMWSGLLHRRCRVTPFPVRLEVDDSTGAALYPPSDAWLDTVTNSSHWDDYRCLSVPNFESDEDIDWSKDESPWSVAQDCFWPVDEEDERTCTHNTGVHKCPSSYVCGSSYDALGNRRFKSDKAMQEASFIVGRNWGFTDFDNMPRAFLTIFQCITMEGWTDIMYFIMDSYSGPAAAILFMLLILFGSFFLLNLTLAVIWDEFDKANQAQMEKEEQDRVDKIAQLVRAMEDPPAAAGAAAGAGAGAAAGAAAGAGAGAAQVEDPTALAEAQQALSELEAGGSPAHNRRRSSIRVAPDGMEYDQDVVNKRGSVGAVVTHAYFSYGVTGLIVANTIVLAMDHHPMPETMAEDLEYVNFILTILFTVEMVLKLSVLHRSYFHDRFNCFDAFIVTVSLIELAATPPAFISGDDVSSGGGISALRTFRLFRVFKLARSWTSLRELLETILKTLSEVANFGILLLLFMYIYALVGMQFFANKMHFADDGYAVEFGAAGYAAAEVPRSNFDDLLWAFTTIFQVLTGENWNSVMYDCWRATNWVAAVYFVSLVIFGNLIVMNLFLAILLSNFEEDPEFESGEDSVEDVAAEIVHQQQQQKKQDKKKKEKPSSSAKVAVAPDEEAVVVEEEPRAEEEDRFDETAADTPVKPSALPLMAMVVKKAQRAQALQLVNPETAEAIAAHRRSSAAARRRSSFAEEKEKMVAEEVAMRNTSVFPLLGKSLFLFEQHNELRVACANVVSHPRFENGILTLIFISSITLGIDNPLYDPDSPLVTALTVLDWMLTILFTLEMTLKIVAMGFVGQPKSYLRNSWNMLDFAIVCISIVSLFTSGNSSLKSLRSLRTLRALRPLRMISRKPGLKLVVNALFASIPSILNVVFVCLLFFLIFSIGAVSYLKGTFKACQGDYFDGVIAGTGAEAYLVDPGDAYASLSNATLTWLGAEGCDLGGGAEVTSKDVCECLGAEWDEVIPQNFDNVFRALSTLFEIATTEGWVDVMLAAVDKTAVDMQPKRNNSEVWVFFFIFFMVVGCFFVMNLFVGVIIDNFNRMKDKLGDNILLTKEQQAWVKTQEIGLKLRPRKKPAPPPGALAHRCFEVITHPYFETIIMTCIIMNTIVMAIQYFGQGEDYTLFVTIANYVFAAVFTLECAAKLTAMRKAYFDDSWNRFDFAIVLGTNAGLILKWITGQSIGSIATVIRSFRVGRIVRLINGAKSLRHLFNTLMLTLPSLSNIASLLFLLFFIYAVMGVQLYAAVGYYDAYDEHAHFRTFWSAMLLLLRACTGENWNGLMHAIAADRPGCDSDPEYDSDTCGYNDSEDCVPLNGCGSSTIFPFLISFTLLVTFVLLNLFVAVILPAFTETDEDQLPLTPQEFEQFVNAWSEYDPDASCFISTDQLGDFLQNLYAPMGFGKEYEAAPKELQARIKELDLPIYSANRVHFKDVMFSLTRRAVEESIRQAGGVLQALPADHQINAQWSKLADSASGDHVETGFSVESHFASQTIQRAWLAHRCRAGVNNKIKLKEETEVETTTTPGVVSESPRLSTGSAPRQSAPSPPDEGDTTDGGVSERADSLNI